MCGIKREIKMNQHLQSISTIIQQDENLPVEQKKSITKALKEADKELEITASKLVRTEKVNRTTSILLEETITELKQKRNAVEAQNRELEIEAALERVRAVAMSMRKPEELTAVGEIIFKELKGLGFTNLRNTEIIIINDTKKSLTSYYYSDYGVTGVVEVLYTTNPTVKKWVNDLKKSNDAFAEVVIGENEMAAWRKYREEVGYLPDPKLNEAKTIYYYSYSIGLGGLSISTFKAASNEQIKILERFRNVFDLAYQRYSDIEQAQAQAREAQIELALERIRARTMAMQKSEELADTAYVLFRQFKELGETPHQITIAIIKEAEGLVEFNITSGDGSGAKVNSTYTFNIDEPTLIQKLVKAWKENKKSTLIELAGKDLTDWVAHRSLVSGISDNTDYKNTRRYVVAGFFSKGLISISTAVPIATETILVLERFAQVFQQTYTRFLDLQKAEAQAREAQIEAALERVRARSMAMHTSHDLKNVITVVIKQLVNLDFDLDLANFNFLSSPREWTMWLATPNFTYPELLRIPAIDHPLFNRPVEALKKGLNFMCDTLTKDEFRIAWQHLYDTSMMNEYDDGERREYIKGSKGFARSIVFMKQIALTISNFKGVPYTEEQNALLGRFANVFEQTYTRFLDLQKAEAQARESKIEAALERVRSSSLAMHRSDELQGVINTVIEQLQELHIEFDTSNILIFNSESKSIEFWTGTNSTGEQLTTSWCVPYTDYPLMKEMYQAQQSSQEVFLRYLSFKEKNRFFNYIFTNTDFRNLNAERKKFISESERVSILAALVKKVAIQILSYSRKSFLLEEIEILKRFAKVFEQAYTRFLDLQKAEAQAREAQIEAGLERVRSRSLAMHNTSELQEVIHTVHKELLHLNIAISGGSFIAINNDIDTALRCWGSGGTANTTEEVHLPFYKKPFCTNLINGIKSAPGFFTEEFTQQEKKHFFTFLFKHEPWSKLDEKQKKETLASAGGYTRSCCVSRHTSIFIVNHFGEKFSDADNNILQRFGKVFEQTYTRFLDLQKAEAQAREAQIELGLERVRARAMAMRKSDELAELVDTVFKELTKLDFALTWCIINIINESSLTNTVWAANPDIDKAPESYHMKFEDYPYHHAILKDWRERKTKSVYTLEKDEKRIYDDYLFNETEFKRTPEIAQAASRAMEKYVCSFSFCNFGGLQTVGDAPLSEANLDIISRFGKVFELTYTRFNDLKQAEAQAREARIEAALERVRSKTMAMHNSQDVGETVATLFDQLVQLGIKTNRCGILIFSNTNNAEVWTAKSNPDGDAVLVIGHLDTTIHPLLMAAHRAWKNKEAFFSYEMEGDNIKGYYSAINNHPDYPTRFNLDNLPPREIHSDFIFLDGAVFAFTSEPIPKEEALIFEKISAVFGQTYRRYLDLQKAEAQAREAQIELALERVRARSMAMQKSDELAEAAQLLYHEFGTLGINTFTCGYLFIKEEKNIQTAWVVLPDGTLLPNFIDFPLTGDHVMDNRYKAWKEKKPLHILEIQGEVNKEHHRFLSKHVPASVVEDIFSRMPDRIIFYCANFSDGYLFIISTEFFSSDEEQTIVRFAKVFEMTYRRFLDLQKAEAQAREAQIELGLERVRARAMAMQKSNELSKLVDTVFKELTKLHFTLDRCIIIIVDEKSASADYWMANPESKTPTSYHLEFRDIPYLIATFNAWKERKVKTVYDLKGNEKSSTVDYIFSKTELQLLPAEVKEGMKNTSRIFLSASFNNFGGLQADTIEPLSEDNLDILNRFAKVFDLTYTRFNDLQKAEAQAREAQIELALERVRARTMAMQHSDELQDTSLILFQQLKQLGEPAEQCTVGIIKESEGVVEISATLHGNKMQQTFRHKIDEPFVMNKMFRGWKDQQKKLVLELKEDELKKYNQYRNKLVGKETFPVKLLPGDRRVIHIAYFSKGMLALSTNEPRPAESLQLLERFAIVFEQTYTRFLDLQKAEAQAREAQIEAALERVRSRTLAMQKSDELAETAAEVFKQLIGLGIEPSRLYIGIIHDESGDMEMWATDEDGTRVGKKFMFNKNENASVKKLFDGWMAKEKSVVVDMRGKELKDYFHYLKDVMQIPFKGGLSQKRRVQSVAYFSKGFIGMASPDGQGNNTIQLLERFAGAFNLTFTRFNDLKIAEAHALQAEEDLIKLQIEKQRAENALTNLQVTQKQLIQSEKMASLGELTAGIAHEIQNPLNFVNNFSEVSAELVVEMEDALQKNDKIEAIAIAGDIKENLQKITHHGKRADAIVKGMLQHSRSSTYNKEPTDINKLADEYLRLAYHGLRAKDKTFNATMQTHYDESLEKINIIPQDIGRVILNLITNAFYSVTEKKKLCQAELVEAGYDPLVTVSTTKSGDKVEICVKDNGNGIPKKVLEKIFQPFFTTKPTGQGTGLGLSLSYDIVKAHGGEFKVETKEGEGAEFVIQIPV